MTERKIKEPTLGQKFKFNRKLYECVLDTVADCEGCAFNGMKACLGFECRAEYRDDILNVKFIELDIKDYVECESTWTEGLEIKKEVEYFKKDSGIHVY